jgi:Short C-terminal domain
VSERIRAGPAADDGLVSRLADLARLRESGALSAAEFEAAKARLLAS